MSETQFTTYMISQWVLVVGTLLLAAVALWGHLIRARFLGPRLQIALKSPLGEASKFSDGVLSRYYHLRITNRRRAAPAHNVRVVVKAVFRPRADETMVPAPLSGPVQLTWQFQGQKPQFQTIGAESVCDLGYIREGEDFTLSALYRAISFDPRLAGGQKMIVSLVALSDELESNQLNLEIAWDGDWSRDPKEMSRHLVIKEANDPATGSIPRT